MSDMTIQNAIHCMKAMICEEVCEECDYYGKTGTDHCEADAVRMAIKALQKKTERKIPNYYGDGYADGYMVYDSAECPSCGYIYEEDDGVWGEPYCPHCGQALYWDMKGEEGDGD